jgi:hypothetical protein
MLVGRQALLQLETVVADALASTLESGGDAANNENTEVYH